MCRRAQLLSRCLVLLVCLVGCGRQPVDSSDITFGKAGARVRWMSDRIKGGAPSNIKDAHFVDEVRTVTVGHGSFEPARTIYRFYAKIEIDPNDAPQWIARMKAISAPSDEPRHMIHPFGHARAKWALPEDELPSVQWYEPESLFDKDAHQGYVAGSLALNEDGTVIYVWQRWN